MKKIYQILKILFFSNIGAFLGRALYDVFWYRNHPEIYRMASAPWYTNILVNGIFTAMIAVVLGAAVLILNTVIKNRDKREALTN